MDVRMQEWYMLDMGLPEGICLCVDLCLCWACVVYECGWMGVSVDRPSPLGEPLYMKVMMILPQLRFLWTQRSDVPSPKNQTLGVRLLQLWLPSKPYRTGPFWADQDLMGPWGTDSTSSLQAGPIWGLWGKALGAGLQAPTRQSSNLNGSGFFLLRKGF